MSKKLYIETYGCQMNVADSEVVASVMQMAGYEPTDNEEDADAVFLNTCSVRENAENKIYHRLDTLFAQQRRHAHDNPEANYPKPTVTPTTIRKPTIPSRSSACWAVWPSA